MRRVEVALLFLSVTILLGGEIGCKKAETEAVIPASDYVAPETPPTYASRTQTAVTPVTLTEITKSAGIDFQHVTGAFGQKWMPETMGGGGGFLDYDGDGKSDILLVNSTYWPGHEPEGPRPTSALYRNLGEGNFENVTDAAGLSKLSFYGMGFAAADYDGDGDTDIYMTAVGSNHLLRNDSDRFVDVTDQAGVGFSQCEGEPSPWEWSVGSTWVDYDRDGDLDLFVANYVQWTPETDIWTTTDGKSKTYATPQQYQGATCVLFRNDRDGKFTDVTKSAGVYNPNGKSLSVVADDFNYDGWADLVITNDTQPNFLYMNNRDGTFTNRALSAGVAYDENGLARAGMGVSVSDVNNTGSRSIAIGNFAGEPISLYTQAGMDAFVDRAGATRLTKPTSKVLTFGLLFADFNLDGFDDLILANGHIEPDIGRIREGWTFAQPAQLFLNDTQGRFVDASTRSGVSLQPPMVGRGVSVADIDDDGDLDVLITANGGCPRLLRNDQNGDRRSVRVRLVGDAPNREAIGARIHATIADRTVCRFIRTGGSYLSQSELTATFGVATNKHISRLEVYWPDGSTRSIESLDSGSIQSPTYIVQQGRAKVKTLR